MDGLEVIALLKHDYPGKTIVCLPERDPAEIICEVDPSSEHPQFSSSIAAIKSSKPHYHNLAEETYVVLRGRLDMFIDGKHLVLNEGERVVVPPKSIHFAKGDFTLVQVDSSPGWTPSDHILAAD